MSASSARTRPEASRQAAAAGGSGTSAPTGTEEGRTSNPQPSTSTSGSRVRINFNRTYEPRVHPAPTPTINLGMTTTPPNPLISSLEASSVLRGWTGTGLRPMYTSSDISDIPVARKQRPIWRPSFLIFLKINVVLSYYSIDVVDGSLYFFTLNSRII